MIKRLLDLPKRSFFLFGPRLTGKSTLIKTLLPDALKIDLLEESNFQRFLANPSLLESELKSFQKKDPRGWVVIDEIQRVPALLNEVHRTIENSKLRFALSGSSARKLKRGGANLLAGRASDLRLFPLTSVELGPQFDLDTMIRWGGLPPVYTEDPSVRKAILQSYTTTYLLEEIQAEGIVRNLPAFARFLQLAAETSSQEVNLTALSQEVSTTVSTIKAYYQILEDTLIGFYLPPWKKTVRKQLAGSPKFYLFDTGVTNALRENLTDIPTGTVYGALFEQWVVQEVRALTHYLGFEGSLYYWKARGGNEVDLILSRGSKPILAVEIKSTDRPSKRDLSGLESFHSEYPQVPRLLVTRQSRSAEINGIETLPAGEFLSRLWAQEWISTSTTLSAPR